MLEIVPNLLLGTQRDSRNEAALLAAGVSHLLCVADSFRFPANPSLAYLHVPLSDEGASVLSDSFEKCFRFIETARVSDGKVLLFCRQCQNRSPSIAIAYLMRSANLSLREAYELVRKKRPEACPHESYFLQLQRMEQALRGEISFSETDRGGSIQEAIRDLRKITD